MSEFFGPGRTVNATHEFSLRGFVIEKRDDFDGYAIRHVESGVIWDVAGSAIDGIGANWCTVMDSLQASLATIRKHEELRAKSGAAV